MNQKILHANESTWYAIGDIQGCYSTLTELLRQIPCHHPLVFLGDIVNRGENSLATLRQIAYSNAAIVLGNHDMHLIAVALGIRPMGQKDTLMPILEAHDRDFIVDWLRFQPFVRKIISNNQEFIALHAGVFPTWDRDDILNIAEELHHFVTTGDFVNNLRQLFGNSPNCLEKATNHTERMRVALNAFTRMRFLNADGSQDFHFKGHPKNAPSHLTAWFDFPARRSAHCQFVTGHWSTLGLRLTPNHIGLDTACVWGGELTAYPLNNNRKINQAIQVTRIALPPVTI